MNNQFDIELSSIEGVSINEDDPLLSDQDEII